MDAAMDATAAWDLIAAERRAFADELDTLTPEQWAAPSLCGRWTVREVVAHMMVGQTGTMLGFMKTMARSRFRFAEANHRLAVERAARHSTEELTEAFRTHAGHRFTPPGSDWHAPLTDLLVHRLDVVVPLGLDARRPSEVWREPLSFLANPKGVTGFIPRGLPDLTYAATDLDWSQGAGPRVEAPAEALALAILRRPVRVGELSGPGSESLAAWARR